MENVPPFLSFWLSNTSLSQCYVTFSIANFNTWARVVEFQQPAGLGPPGLLAPKRAESSQNLHRGQDRALWSLGSIGRSENALLEVGEWKTKSIAHCLGHLWQLLFSQAKKKT